MVLISMGGEARTPSDHHMGPPRYGGCVGAFLHFFDWNPGKRFYQTKRLPACEFLACRSRLRGKLDDGLRRSRSLRSDSGSAVRTRMMCDAQPPEDASTDTDEGSVASQGASGIIFAGDSAGASSRAPSVVARLMGLESLPKGPYQPSNTTRHRRSRSYSGAGELPFGFMTRVDEPPVMLQELLQRDFKSSKKTLRDRMPEFAKRAHEQYEHRFAKKGVSLKVLMQDDYMSSFIDSSDVQSSSKQPFLQRLAPATPATPDSSAFEVSMDEGVPELGLQAVGWPLAGKVSHESSFRSERSSLLESECSSSRPASMKSSKPALANVARKIFQGRRRAAGTTNWNGSEDSESTSSHVEADSLLIPFPLQHRKPVVAGRETTLQKVAKSLSPPARRDRDMRSLGTTHHEASARESKSSGTRLPAISKATRTSSSPAKTLLTIEDADDSGQADLRLPLIQSKSRSTDFQPTVVEYPNSRTSPAASASQESTTTTSLTSNMPLTSTVSASLSKGTARPGAKSTRISKPDAVSTILPAKLASKAPPLDGYRAPKVMRGGKKPELAKGSLIPGYGKLLGGDKVKARKGGEMQRGVVQSTKNTLQGIQRVRETMLANAVPPVGDRLKRGASQDEMATPSNGTPMADDTNAVTVCGNRKNGVVSKHARALSIDDVFPELSLVCHAPTDAKIPVCTDASKPPPAVVMEVLSEQVFDVDLQEFFAAGPDDLRWEEEEKQRVHSRELSGRFCERSCSGPSVSSASVGASDVDDERRGDAWSSCASFNSADCDSPRTFELLDTDADECDLHEPKALPMFVKKKTVTAADESAGQPSPVSILNSPFHDEAGNTSECTLNSDDDGFKSPSSNSRIGEAIPTGPTANAADAHNDKIRQALLDISMFQSFTFDYKEASTPRETEQGLVREILSAAELMATPGCSPNWFDQDVAIDPGLMDRLGDMDRAEAGGMWPCDRKLLIDSVKEAFAATMWQHWRGGAESMPGPQRRCWSLPRPRPRGQKLVAEVYKQIQEWRMVTALSLDFLIERDMELSDWKRFGAHVADVGSDVESMVWKAVVEELVVDLATSLKPRR